MNQALSSEEFTLKPLSNQEEQSPTKRRKVDFQVRKVDKIFYKISERAKTAKKRNDTNQLVNKVKQDSLMAPVRLN